jgi:hypothetical protein
MTYNKIYKILFLENIKIDYNKITSFFFFFFLTHYIRDKIV